MAIPHKSRAFRLILDLSFDIKIDGKQMSSMNDTLNEAALCQSLDYIGTALPRIIHVVATVATETPCIFSKADIKDSF